MEVRSQEWVVKESSFDVRSLYVVIVRAFLMIVQAFLVIVWDFLVIVRAFLWLLGPTRDC